MERSIFLMLLFRIQIGLFALCMNGVGSSYQIMKLTQPCELNRSCVLPCRLHPYIKVNVLWFNGNDEMLSQGIEIRKYHGNLKIEKPVYDEWNLRIHRLSRNYEGTYHCDTSLGVRLSEITLVIEHKPKIDENNSSLLRVFVKENSVAELKCIFSGIPEPEITWYRGQSEELIEGIHGYKLVIGNATRYASDEYTCKATNIHGFTKWHIKLIVNFAPEVSVMEPEVHVAGGDEVTLGCIVQASPFLDAFWTNNKGIKVVNSTWKYEVNVEKESDIFPVRFLEFRIKPHIVSVQDEGRYTCHGVGDDQETSSAVVLKVGD